MSKIEVPEFTKAANRVLAAHGKATVVLAVEVQKYLDDVSLPRDAETARAVGARVAADLQAVVAARVARAGVVLEKPTAAALWAAAAALGLPSYAWARAVKAGAERAHYWAIPFTPSLGVSKEHALPDSTRAKAEPPAAPSGEGEGEGEGEVISPSKAIKRGFRAEHDAAVMKLIESEREAGLPELAKALEAFFRERLTGFPVKG